MPEISRFPYAEVEFDKHGAVHDRHQVDALHAMLQSGPVSDLVVMSHGWNNDMKEARELYEKFLGSFRSLLDAKAVPAAGNRSFGVVGVLWPSKRFADSDLIPSGAASLATAGTQELLAEIDQLAAAVEDPASGPPLAEAKQLVPQLENDPEAQKRFANLVRSVLTEDAADEEDASSRLFTAPPEQLMEDLRNPPAAAVPPPAPAGSGGVAAVGAIPPPPAAGQAAGVGDIVASAKAAARRLVNFATYYQMKERAGIVGRGGVNAVLTQVSARQPNLRVHLVGHSFGGRLVTAAASAGGFRPDTLSLLQAAFSHYGFAQRWDGTADGLFRPVVTGGLVSGPILITCTRNDNAVGRAYPIASQIARQTASWTGDKNDKYGGIGSNGAQKTPEASDGHLLPVGGTYTFRPGRLHNLTADQFISDHSTVWGREVAYAVLTAISGT
jgi:hypothetical protein